MRYTSHEECNIGMKIEPKIDMIRKQKQSVVDSGLCWHASIGLSAKTTGKTKDACGNDDHNSGNKKRMHKVARIPGFGRTFLILRKVCYCRNAVMSLPMLVHGDR